MAAVKLFGEISSADALDTVSIETDLGRVWLWVGDERVSIAADDAVRLATCVSAAAWHVMFGGD